VVDEMQDSVRIDRKSIIAASQSVSSSNEISPSHLTCRDWHYHYERYNKLKMETAHFYNTLASSLPGINNGFLKSSKLRGGVSIIMAILDKNPEFYLDEIVDAYLKQKQNMFIHLPSGAN
jgi:hypothetical protein